MKSKTLIISILLIGCNLSQEQNLYIESPENYIPDVSFTEGVLLTQQIKEELDLFEYINSLYIDPLTYAYNHLEELYNGKLFKNEEMVLNIRKDFLFDDNTTGKINYTYIFNRKGLLSSVINNDNESYSTSFTYNSYNLLDKIVKNNKSIPMTKREGHSVTYYESENIKDEIKFEYLNNKLISQTSFNGYSKSKRNYLYSPGNNKSEFFIKFKDTKFFGRNDEWEDKFMFFFKNNRIDYVLTFYGDDTKPLKNLNEIYDFEYYGNKIVINVFENDGNVKSGNKFGLKDKYTVQVSKDKKKIEQVFLTYNYNHKSNEIKNDYYYEYYNSNNSLTGYNIFIKENDETKYKLKNGFHIVRSSNNCQNLLE